MDKKKLRCQLLQLPQSFFPGKLSLLCPIFCPQTLSWIIVLSFFLSCNHRARLQPVGLSGSRIIKTTREVSICHNSKLWKMLASQPARWGKKFKNINHSRGRKRDGETHTHIYNTHIIYVYITHTYISIYLWRERESENALVKSLLLVHFPGTYRV